MRKFVIKHQGHMAYPYEGVRLHDVAKTPREALKFDTYEKAALYAKMWNIGFYEIEEVEVEEGEGRMDQDKETLFLNPITEEMKAFDTIIFQKRDGNYISDAYRNDIGIVADSLEVLANFREMLDPNTLCRICGAMGYEIIEIMKRNTAIKKWLEDE